MIQYYKDLSNENKTLIQDIIISIKLNNKKLFEKYISNLIEKNIDININLIDLEPTNYYDPIIKTNNFNIYYHGNNLLYYTVCLSNTNFFTKLLINNNIDLTQLYYGETIFDFMLNHKKFNIVYYCFKNKLYDFINNPIFLSIDNFKRAFYSLKIHTLKHHKNTISKKTKKIRNFIKKNNKQIKKYKQVFQYILYKNKTFFYLSHFNSITNNIKQKKSNTICYSPYNYQNDDDNPLNKKYLTNILPNSNHLQTSEHGWYISDHDFCIYCNEVYHYGCDQDYDKIKQLFNLNFYTETYELFNIIKSYANNIHVKKLAKEKNIKELYKYKKMLLKIIHLLSDCLRLKITHHNTCTKNIYDTSKKLGDRGHEKFLLKLIDTINICQDKLDFIEMKSLPLSIQKYSKKSGRSPKSINLPNGRKIYKRKI